MWAIKERLAKERLEKTWQPTDIAGESGQGGRDQNEIQESSVWLFLVLFCFVFNRNGEVHLSGRRTVQFQVW